MSTVLDLDGITEETIAAVAKAQTSGINSGTGIAGVDLNGLVSLVPVETPWRNMLPREQSTDGAKVTQWKALLNVNSSQPLPASGFDYAGGLVQIDEQDVFSGYAPLAMAARVTQDAIDLAKGYADAQAVATLQALLQLQIGEDKIGMGGQAFALPAIATPTLSTASTGGSIAASANLDIKVAPRAGWNWFYGGSGPASSVANITVGSGTSTNTVTASVGAVHCGVAFDWYIGTHNGTLYYYTTTTTGSCTFTSNPGSAQSVPSLPDISSLLPGTGVNPVTQTAGNGQPTGTDTSYVASGQGQLFNGALAVILGDYGSNAVVTPGTGTASSGATFIDAGASTLTLSGAAISQVDLLLMDIYQATKLSPTALMMNSQHAQDMTNKLLGTSAAYTLLGPDDAAGRAGLVAGGYIRHYVNKAANGSLIRIEVHPSLPQGTIIARTDRVPFPGANITNVWSIRTLRDYASFVYGANYNPGTSGGGPRQDSEVRSLETLCCRAPVAQGVLTNVAAG